MRAMPVALVLGFFAAIAAGTETPDYSRQSLMRTLTVVDETHPPIPPNVQWHLGYVEFPALGMRWRVIYLPLMMPFSGSGPHGAGTLPNPFALTGTSIASTMPPMFDHDRSWQVEREYRRIMRTKRKQ